MKNKSNLSIRVIKKILINLSFLFLLGILLTSCGQIKKTETIAFRSNDLTTYFISTIEAEHLKNPDNTYYLETITIADISKYRDIIWEIWKRANVGRLTTWPTIGANQAKDSLLWFLPTGKKTLFAIYKKGSRPAGGYPLFINLHGGGTMPEAKDAWGSLVNNREWKAAKYLGTKYADTPSLYFVPRMADDRRGRWYHKGEQTEFIRAWQLGVLSGDIDPNKTYIMGISEGGYGSFRMGPFFADYFAGAGPMAGSIIFE